jgi:hypothetical protein
MVLEILCLINFIEYRGKLFTTLIKNHLEDSILFCIFQNPQKPTKDPTYPTH